MIQLRAAVSVVTLAAAVSLTACGGGGGGSASVPAPHAIASAAATAAPAGPTAQVVFRIGSGGVSTASTARTPKFVSPSTASATVALQGQATPLTTVNLTTSSPNCTTDVNGFVCTVSVNAPVGQDTFVITTYDGQNGSGNVLSTGTVVATIVLNSNNTVSLALSGVVATAAVILGSSSVQAGTPATVAVTVVAYDAKQNVIIGPGNYTSPVTLTNSDTSGVTHLSTAQVAGPGTSVTLSYSGASSLGATITPSVGGTANPLGAATFAPTGYAFSTFALTQANSNVEVMTAGPDGNVWFTQYATVGFMTPSGTSTIYTDANGIPDDDFYALATGANGAVWFGGDNAEYGSVTPGGLVTMVTSISTPNGCGNGGQAKSLVRRNAQATTTGRRNAQVMAIQYACGASNWMVAGPDGRLWFSDDSGMIGNIDPATGALIEWDITQMPSWPGGAIAEPAQIQFGSDGAIYAADPQGLLDRITVSNGVVTDATQLPGTTCLGPGSGPWAMAIGTDGTIWTADYCSNLIAVPVANFSGAAAQSWSLIPVIGNEALYYMIPSPGGIWAIDEDDSNVFRITTIAGSNPVAPAISTLTPVTTAYFADALAIGPDGNLWVDGAPENSGPDVLVRTAYGAPPIGSMSRIRALPAASRSIAKVPAGIRKHPKHRLTHH